MSATEDTEGESVTRSAGLLTIPNALCVVRLLGSFVLVGVAFMDFPRLFLWLYVFLAMTDWIDGKLAILLDQRSEFGARLDSWADAALYGALLIGALWLHGPLLQSQLAWIIPALITYVASTCYGFWKFGRWPSYHTRMAKTSWLLVTVATIMILGRWSVWPLRIAMAAVSLTNLEAMLITHRLTEWRADIRSIVDVGSENHKHRSK